MKNKCEIIWILKTPKGNLMHLLGNWINRLSRWIFISITNLAINTSKVLHYYKGNFTRCLRFCNIMFNAQNILSHSKMLSLLYTILEKKKKRQIILKEKSKAVHWKLEYVHFLTNEQYVFWLVFTSPLYIIASIHSSS